MLSAFEALYLYHKAVGRPPESPEAYNEFRSWDCRRRLRWPSAARIILEFGSWSEALRRAFPGEEFRVGRDVSAVEVARLLDKMRCLGTENGGVLPMDRAGHRLYNQVIAFFGTWNEAVRAAGLRITRRTLVRAKRKKFSDEEILAVLKEAAEKVGGTPGHLEYQRLRARYPEWPSSALAARRFGSWKKALEAAGLSGLPSLRERRARVRAEKERELAACAVGILRRRPFLVAGECRGAKAKFVTDADGSIVGGKRVILREPYRSWFVRAAENGFPLPSEDVPRLRKGWELALLLAQEGSLAAVGRAVGLTRERVRQIVVGYLRHVTAEARGAAEAALREAAAALGAVPTAREYEELRQSHPGWPSWRMIMEAFGGWRKAVREIVAPILKESEFYETYRPS